MTALAIALVTLGVLGFAAYLMWLSQAKPSIKPKSAGVATIENLASVNQRMFDAMEKLTERVGALELQLALRRGPSQPKASPHA